MQVYHCHDKNISNYIDVDVVDLRDFLNREILIRHHYHELEQLSDSKSISELIHRFERVNVSRYKSFVECELNPTISSANPQSQLASQGGGKSVVVNPVTTVNRIVFIDHNGAAKEKFKSKKKEDAQSYKRVIAFLQGSIGIAMSSSNPDHLPVLVCELSWLDLRNLSTALAKGVLSEIEAFISTKPHIRRVLKLIIQELKHRAEIMLESSSHSTASSSASASIASASSASSGATGTTASHLFPNNNSSDNSLYYAILYSSKDDRYDLASYSYSAVSLLPLLT